MQQVPQEILLFHIFSQLSRSEWFSVLSTCKLWRTLGRLYFDASRERNKAIRWACKEGKTECVRSLLKDKRVDPSAANNEPIRSACQYGHLEIVKILMRHKKVDPTAHNGWAIGWARYYF